ncbi:hypothetical protein N9F37_00525 [bacterium]|nr:hypothetical protein [Akkermansiaceae bacterium]MDA7536794.1 hypothetical protein [bacterium]MDA7519300.1 hypothetical protein [Akkermansiaceae bacterium]MDA7538161.1 hypothetical protein [Akkermansiaceae bacterium]MDA7629200.1 hypothetical protein [Akkermansiaceae bacterium]
MKKIISILALVLLILPLHSKDEDLWTSKGPHVRIKRNNFDGSHVVFKRTPDDKKLVKTTKDKNNNVTMTATYFRNDRGFLTAGRIYDGQGDPLFRVRYGYDKKTGYLVAEDMFDSRVKFERPTADGKMEEMPVRRIYYWYDEDGNQSKAISLVAKKGQMAKDVFPGKGDDTKDLYKEEKFDPTKATNPLIDNPFEEEKKKANR